MKENLINNATDNAPTSEHPAVIDTPEPLSGTVIDFTADEIKLYETLKQEIEQQASNIREAIFEIGKRLFYINQHQLYKIEGYTSISAMAADKLGLNRKACSNYIGFCECFGDIDEETGSCTGLLPEYQDAEISKLEALLPVARKYPSHLSEFSTKMTCDEIKAKKQAITGRKKKEVSNQKVPEKEEGADTNITEEAATEPPVSESHPDSPASEEQKPMPPAKRPLKKSKKLLELKNLEELSPENSALIQKVKEFRQRHPGKKYFFSISILYEEETV